MIISLAVVSLQSCSSTATAVPKLVWGMQPKQVWQYLQQRKLREIKDYLNNHRTPQAMQQALLLGEDSLYTIALIFAEAQEWQLYHRAMLVHSYSGSEYGRKFALDYMAEHEIFSQRDRLSSLEEYLKKQPQAHEQLVRAAILALAQGKVELAQGYWLGFSSKRQANDLNLEQSMLALKLALLRRDQLRAGNYMQQVLLNFTVTGAHKELQRDLRVRPEWWELLHSGENGPLLLQSLDWKVALLQKEFSATLPVLFAEGQWQDGKEILSDELRFWWSQPILIEDTGRAIFSANHYRSQSQNVQNGRRRLQSLIDEQTSLVLDQETYNNLVYWSIRNNRNYSKMEKYRFQFRRDDSLRPWLLTEYLYFFKNVKYWADFPGFLRSWYRERPEELNLNNTSIRLFRQIYHDMSLAKKTALLEQVFQAALLWGEEALILDSAWNYRLAKGEPLSQSEWRQIPLSIRGRVLSDSRLFVLRTDQGEDLLPQLRDVEPHVAMSSLQKALHDILSMLIDHGFHHEALRLARIYHSELPSTSIVDFSRRIQAQGLYDVGMRMVAQLTYDDNYNISREALKLLYPKAFFELMHNFSQKHDLSLSIFYGLVRQESYFAPAVVSHAGAVGLSQLMPATMHEVAQKIGYSNPDATDPETSLQIGSYYLRYLIDHRWTNNFAQALMAYNAGLGNIRRWKARFGSLNGLEFNNTVPVLETRLYVQKVSAAAIYYSALYNWNDPIFVLHTIYPDDFPDHREFSQGSQ